MSKKIGIVFSGGGALGSWHVGVLKHKFLVEKKSYDIYGGVSAGALVAGYIAQFSNAEREQAIDNIEKTMLSIKKPSVYKMWNPIEVIKNPFKVSSLVNSEPLQNFIKANIDPEKIKHSNKQLRIGATSLYTGEFQIFTENSKHLPEAIAASTAVPGWFCPVCIPDKPGLWVDGGIRTMTPIASLIRAGCDEIDVSICFPKTSNQYNQENVNLLNVMLRSIMIMKDEILWSDFRKAELYNELVLLGQHKDNKKYIKLNIFSPDKDLNYRIFDFDPKLLKKYSEKGFQKAKETSKNRENERRIIRKS